MRVYISADYDENDGDREVADLLNAWGTDCLHKVEFIDTAKVKKGSVTNNPDCRICDLKAEFNRQIASSSHVIIIVGDQTALRRAGSSCDRVNKNQNACWYTPYKHNIDGARPCKVLVAYRPLGNGIGNINNFSYIHHEFMQADSLGKKIIVFYNSLYKQANWLPPYMSGYEGVAAPFWIRNANGNIVGNYDFLKKELGYE